MKTDIQQALCLAMTSFFILSAVIKPSEEKCAGRWAIHACWGGNGKRSDSSMDLAPAPSVLRQLLLRNRPVLVAPGLDSGEELALPGQSPEDVDSSSSYSSDLPDYNVLPPSPSLSRLAALLKTLRTLQRENRELP